MELHELPGGVVLLNDAYNANPESMRAALDALASIGADPAVRRTVAVLGEMRELGDGQRGRATARSGEYAAERGSTSVVVVGEAARGIHDGAAGTGAQRLRRRQRRGRRLARASSVRRG